MKRLLGLLMAVMVVLFSTTAFADNYWTKTWAQGEYTITLTPEDEAAIADLWKKMDERSAGTWMRSLADSYTLEMQFEAFLEGRNTSSGAAFDDIGEYKWAIAMPDENAISQEAAFQLAVMAIQQQFDVSFDELAAYYPEYKFQIVYPNQPNAFAMWQLTFSVYADDATGQEVYYAVALYAEDGSIWAVDAAVRGG
ncbi:MAG TPA: hypothetical protein OGM06_09110 [Clostridiales bacterium]|nr:hypothetical protein [Clostridiales bacterium]